MWWIFAVSSAFTQVIRNVIMKNLGHKLDEHINVWGRFTFLLPFALGMSYFKGFPELGNNFWIFSILSGTTVAIMTMFLSRAFKLSDMSISIALWKINVIFLMFFGVLFLDEQITYLGIIGILIAFCGVYFLNIQKARVSIFEPLKMLFRDKGLFSALISGFLLAVTSIFWKNTIILSDIYFPTFANFFFASCITTVIAILKSRKNFKIIPQYKFQFILMGFLAFITNLASNASYSLTNPAYTEAVKQVEIIFASLAGMIFFGEHKRVREIWPGVLMIIGGILIVILYK